jgi:hypothetical protein
LERILTAQIDDVETMALNALHRGLAISPHRLKVEADTGAVTMSGVVDRPYQRGRRQEMKFGSCSRRRTRSEGAASG